MNREDSLKGIVCVVRKFLPALILLLTPHHALAQGNCTAPVPPPPVDGADATPEQLRAAIAHAREFIGQANLYENCLRQELDAAKARDGDGQAVNAAFDRETKVRIAVNRRLKDKVSSEAASAIDAYKKAHPD
jgi:hypothetical protein